MCDIGRGLRTVSGETAAGILLGLTVFCFVLGSSSVSELVGPGKKLRWIGLFALTVLALGLAARARRERVSPRYLVALGVGASLAAVGLVSATWSVDPHLTFGRAASFAVLFVAAGALGVAVPSCPTLAPSLLLGILAGTTAAALAGVLMLAIAHGDAVQPVTTLYPARFRGLGLNPDTLAMLEGMTVPVGIWALLAARRRSLQALALGVLLLLLGSISASGSRGGLLAAFVGGLTLSLTVRRPARQRLVLALSVVLAVAAATGGTQIPKPLPASAVQAPTGKSTGPSLPSIGQSVGAPEPRYAGRLEDELYRVYAGSRSLLGSSGRLQAVVEAVHQADSRPLLGFGFGTENLVYVDRVYNFQGTYVENSFVGFYLQLGAVGLVLLVALLLATSVAVAVAALRGRGGSEGPVLAGVCLAGIVLALVQSYAYSVGNVATVSFWTAGFVGAAVAARERRQSVAVPAQRDEGEFVPA